MHPSLRPLLLATGAFLLSALNASAQVVELLTESPVTLQAVLTTSSTTSSATERRSTVFVSRLSHQQILQDIIGDDTPGWSLVAVRYVPADLSQVDASFKLYAVNGDQRIAVSTEKFAVSALGSVAKYREQHIGQYVLSSSGTVTNHVTSSYLPGFTVNGIPLTSTTSLADGFATIKYGTRDELGGHEVFFYLISSTRAALRGGLRLNNGQDGLITLTVTVGSPRLVPASVYPEVIAQPPGAAISVDF